MLIRLWDSSNRLPRVFGPASASRRRPLRSHVVARVDDSTRLSDPLPISRLGYNHPGTRCDFRRIYLDRVALPLRPPRRTGVTDTPEEIVDAYETPSSFLDAHSLPHTSATAPDRTRLRSNIGPRRFGRTNAVEMCDEPLEEAADLFDPASLDKSSRRSLTRSIADHTGHRSDCCRSSGWIGRSRSNWMPHPPYRHHYSIGEPAESERSPSDRATLDLITNNLTRRKTPQTYQYRSSRTTVRNIYTTIIVCLA
jgi:hypothetical protein